MQLLHDARRGLVVSNITACLQLSVQVLDDVAEMLHLPLVAIVRILDVNHVFSLEGSFVEEIVQVVRLQVHLPDRIVAVHIARWLDGDDVRVLREGLVQHWTRVLSLRVLVELQLDEICCCQRLPSDRVTMKLF